MRQRLYDGDHPAVAGALILLASDLRELGEIQRAQELDQEALAMNQRLFGHDVDVVDTAYSLSGLAADLRLLGDVRYAQKLDEQALAMLQRIYEGDQLDFVARLNKLSIDFRVLGETERAKEFEAVAAAEARGTERQPRSGS